MPRIIIPPVASGSNAKVVNPEARWPVLTAVLGVGGITLALPHALVLGPRWLLPAAVLVLLIPTTLAHRYGRHELDRVLGYAISVLVTVALAGSLVLLIQRLPTKTDSPR